MKKISVPLALALVSFFCFSIFTTGCLKDKCKATLTYKVWKPITKTLAEIRTEVAAAAPQPLNTTGQIYLYQNWLLVGERGEGIHIFDNTNPDDPKNVAFINLPGCIDMAVRDGILLADNFIDLVAVDIKDPLAPKLRSRVENVFPYNQQGGGYITGYELTDETVELGCDSPYYGWDYYKGEGGIFYTSFNCNTCDYSYDASGGTFLNKAPTTGIGGSYARFTIAGDRLYTVDYSNLHAFDISNPWQPNKVGNPVSIGFGIETLFAMGKKLFVGSNSGLFIYDTEGQPNNPVKIGEFTHATACDPVVADGETAFVTLHDGTKCEGFANQLDIVDIAKITEPKLLKTFPMVHPLGLGVRGDQLFVCDEGVKIFDKTDPAAAGDHLLGKISGIEATDIIPVPWSKDLIILSPNGIYQYDATDLGALRQRSLIAVVK